MHIVKNPPLEYKTERDSVPISTALKERVPEIASAILSSIETVGLQIVGYIFSFHQPYVVDIYTGVEIVIGNSNVVFAFRKEIKNDHPVVYLTLFQHRPDFFSEEKTPEYFEIMYTPEQKKYTDYECKKMILEFTKKSELKNTQIPKTRPDLIDEFFITLRDGLVS